MASLKVPFHVIPPAPGYRHSHTVIFLHGWGDNALNFSRSLYSWRDSFKNTLFDVYPSFRWVFPQAPARPCASAPNVVYSQWFELWNAANFTENEPIQAIGLREIVPAIRDVLNSEAILLGGDWSRIILAGISIGAATSLHTLLNLNIPSRLCAFIGVSCRFPFTGRTLEEMRNILGLADVPRDNGVLRETPILLEHCVDDAVVLAENGRMTKNSLVGFGASVEWREYPVGGHWFESPHGVDDVIVFLNHVLGVAGGLSAISRDDCMDIS